MAKEYNPKDIEKKWQEIWDEKGTFYATNDKTKPKFYGLIEFPYPSGAGLHVGHPRSYTALDIVVRKRRLQGYNVLYPIGWDAFGLPTENFAIKNKIHPRVATKQNIATFTKQIKSLGLSFDWSREIDTTDPKYYKWTQWIFLKFFEHGLAYKGEMPINWCTSCKIGLANEEVVNGACERCGGEVVKKVKSQWMLKITDYAEKLIDGLELVNYIERAKVSQINWIGKSVGAEADFKIAGHEKSIKIFTTRPDTMFGATYMVLSPEHPLIDELKSEIINWNEVEKYRVEASKKSDFERSEMEKEKTGVCLEGIKIINPANNKKIQIWISDYVLMTYGTGAIMAVPAHDTRDFEFAKKFDLPIIEVVKGGNVKKEAFTDVEKGILVNSDFLNGLTADKAIEKMTLWLEEKGLGRQKVNYKLHDWIFSRQRYWGEPIPLIHCEKCGWVPVPFEQLPVTLPDVESYTPTDTGESPLAKITDWVNTTCPKCGGHAERETDTMPNWAGSSWYFLRYIDPHNDNEFANIEELKYWLPIDWYNGGMEHVTLHLLYSRFWHKFLYDLGYVTTPEPYQKRTSHGMILGENNEKMSKSKGNVINPDEIVNEYGADTFRTYEMFIGAFDQVASWSDQGVKGCRRFLDRVWKIQDILTNDNEYSKELETKMHQTIKKVGEDIERMKYNTAVASLMSLINEFYDKGKVTKGEFKTFLILLNPTAPHMTEELWQMLGYKDMVSQQKWPEFDELKTKEDVVEVVIQVNGKIISRVNVALGSGEDIVIEEANKVEKVTKALEGKTIVKKIFVVDRLLNIVVR